uniref:Uncharacterized protein n=1 Tax=Janibacter limosus TaxID=53458 RepID=A0AC61U4E5_9MICO|nr:hypothetical protein [Janibacter limosus]
MKASSSGRASSTVVEVCAARAEDRVALADVLLGEGAQGDVPVGAGPGRDALADAGLRDGGAARGQPGQGPAPVCRQARPRGS